MEVLIIVGSERKNGNTDTLLDYVSNGITAEGISVKKIHLSDYTIHPCTGCEGCAKTYRCVIKDDMQKLYPMVLQADAVVLGSPTYFYNITATTKLFIDRLYCFETFDKDDRSVWLGLSEALGGRHALTVAICEQKDTESMGFTSEAMEKPLTALGFRVIDNLKVLHAFKKGDVEQFNSVLEEAKAAGTRLAKTMKLKEYAKKRLEEHVSPYY